MAGRVLYMSEQEQRDNAAYADLTPEAWRAALERLGFTIVRSGIPPGLVSPADLAWLQAKDEPPYRPGEDDLD